MLEESAFKPLEVNSVDLIPSITETGEQNVCVEFPNEPAYGLKTVDIAYIKPMNISLMVDTPLRVELQGFHISAGDQLRIYRNGVCDEENTWTVEENQMVWLTMPAQGAYTMCYKFVNSATPFLPTSIRATVLQRSVSYTPDYVVNGASNTLAIDIWAFNENDDYVEVIGGGNVTTFVENNAMYVSFYADYDTTLPYVTLNYHHANVNEPSTKQLPLYYVSLDTHGAYTGIVEGVGITGSGIDKLQSISFAVQNCTNDVGKFTVESAESTGYFANVNVLEAHLDYHLCAWFSGNENSYFISSERFMVVTVSNLNPADWIAGLPLPSNLGDGSQIIASGGGFSNSSDSLTLSPTSSDLDSVTLSEYSYDPQGEERAIFSSLVTLGTASSESTTVYNALYKFNLLNKEYPTSKQITVYPQKFPASITPEDPVVNVSNGTTTTVILSLSPYVHINMNDKVFLSTAARGCKDADPSELLDVVWSDGAESKPLDMTLEVSAVAGEQLVCYMYGGSEQYTVELLRFVVRQYNGLPQTRFAVGVVSDVELNMVNGGEGDILRFEALGANPSRYDFYVDLVDNNKAVVRVEIPTVGEYNVSYQYANSSAFFATGEVVKVSGVSSVYPTLLMTGETRAFEIEGYDLRETDRLLLSESGDCSEAASSGYFKDSEITFSESGSFYLCYYYDTVGSAVVTSFNVTDITYMGPTEFVNGVEELVTVIGLDEEDDILFVRGTDCNSNVIVRTAYSEEGVNITLPLTYSTISVCYKLSERTDIIRDPKVLIKSMGVDYISSTEWLTDVATEEDTFVLHPVFLTVGDLVVFQMSETDEVEVSTTVKEVSMSGAILNPVKFTSAGSYAVLVTFSNGKTFRAAFEVEIVQSFVSSTSFRSVYMYIDDKTDIPMHFTGVFDFVPVKVKYVSGDCSAGQTVAGTEISLYKNGDEALFKFPSAAVYTFCAKFGNEAWYEVEELRLTFLTLNDQSLVVLNVAEPVEFHLSGNGIREGDSIRWTNTQNGDACKHALLTSSVQEDVAGEFVSSFMIPSSVVDNYLYMCYKIIGDMEYYLFPNNMLDLRGDYKISPSIAFENLPMEMIVEARNWNSNDKVKFVKLDEECTADGLERKDEQTGSGVLGGGRVQGVLQVRFAERVLRGAGVHAVCPQYFERGERLGHEGHEADGGAAIPGSRYGGSGRDAAFEAGD